MGRTEFLPQRLEASPGWKAQTTHESEMALFSECMQECARKVLDTADIVRDGDISTTTRVHCAKLTIFPFADCRIIMS
jgi:hypothetical protein